MQNNIAFDLFDPSRVVPVLRTSEECTSEDQRRFNENTLDHWHKTLEPGHVVMWLHPTEQTYCYTVITELLPITAVDKNTGERFDRDGFRGPTWMGGELRWELSAWLGMVVAGVVVSGVADVQLLSSLGIHGYAVMVTEARKYDPVMLRSDYCSDITTAVDMYAEQIMNDARNSGVIPS